LDPRLPISNQESKELVAGLLAVGFLAEDGGFFAAGFLDEVEAMWRY
jgi:hypothetical protein